MSRHRVKLGLVCLALAVSCAVASSRAEAQLAVASAQPVKKWLADVRELGSKVLPPELFQQFGGALDQISAPGAIKGLDDSRSFGAFADLSPNGEPPLVAILIPVTDANVFLDTLKGFGLGIEEAAAGSSYSHQLTMPDGRTKMFAFPMKNDLYLTLFPVNPARLKGLRPGDLDQVRPKTSSLTVSLRLDRLSAENRAKFIEGYKKSMDAVAARNEGEDEPHFLGRTLSQELGTSGVLGLIQEGKEIAVDVGISPKAGPLSVDLRVSAKPGTPLAATFRKFGERKSLFRGVGPNSVMSAWTTLPSPRTLQRLLPRFLQLMREQSTAKAPEAQKKNIELMFNLIEPNLLADSFDLVASLKGPYALEKSDTPSHVALFCLKVKNAAAMEKSLRENAQPPAFKFDAAKSKDGKVSIHHWEIPDAKFDPLLGRAIVNIAIDKDMVIIGMGEKSLITVREVLEQVANPPALAPQLEASMSMKRTMAFSPDLAQRDVAKKVAEAVFDGPDADKDELRLILKGEGDQIRVRLDADAVVLKFLINMGMTMSNGVMP